MATPSEKQLTDCYWFLQNQCKKGASCEYRHCDAALTNQTNCKFWIEGKCDNLNCTFRHPSGVQKSTAKSDPTQTPCYFFSIGKCTKGDSCPYLHANQSNEELKKIQEERKKEEDRLARLKEEADRLQRQNEIAKKQKREAAQEWKPKKQQNENKAQTQKGKQSAAKSGGGGTFVKSFDEIIKEANKTVPPAEKKKAGRERLQEREKAPNKKQKQEQPATGGPVNFGIKSLDQLLQQKPETQVPTSTPSEATESAKSQNFSLEELRQRNIKKFGQSPVPAQTPKQETQTPKQEVQTPKQETQKPLTRKAEDSQEETEQKRRKLDLKPLQNPPVSPKITPKQPITPLGGQKFDDLDKDLEEFDLEPTDEIVVDDSELDSLMST